MEHAFRGEPIPKDHMEDADWQEHKRGELREIWKRIFADMLEHNPSIEELRERIVRGEFHFVDGKLTPQQVPPEHIAHHIAAVERLTTLYKRTGVPLQDIHSSRRSMGCSQSAPQKESKKRPNLLFPCSARSPCILFLSCYSIF